MKAKFIYFDQFQIIFQASDNIIKKYIRKPSKQFYFHSVMNSLIRLMHAKVNHFGWTYEMNSFQIF